MCEQQQFQNTVNNSRHTWPYQDASQMTLAHTPQVGLNRWLSPRLCVDPSMDSDHGFISQICPKSDKCIRFHIGKCYRLSEHDDALLTWLGWPRQGLWSKNTSGSFVGLMNRLFRLWAISSVRAAVFLKPPLGLYCNRAIGVHCSTPRRNPTGLTSYRFGYRPCALSPPPKFRGV